MDRLTTVNGNNNIELVINESRVKIKDTDTLAVAKKLKEYEDLEEQGGFIKLPCKVGDTVYVKLASYCEEKYTEAKVRDFTYFISCGFCVVVTSEHFDKQNIPFTEFGKTVFLTKSEAEAAMNKLKGKDNKDIERD